MGFQLLSLTFNKNNKTNIGTAYAVWTGIGV